MKARQRGVALITMLLIAALASAIVMTMLSRHHLAIEKTRQVVLGEQALAYARGGEAYAVAVLMADVRERDPDRPLVDSLVESWAEPFEPLAIEDGQVTVEIHDLQGRLNLNNVGAELPAPEEAADESGGSVSGEAAGDAAAPATQRTVPGGNAYDAPLARLLELTGVDADLLGVIRDWVDADEDVSDPFGAEDSDYLLAEPPHRAANAPLVDTTELLAMRGVQARDFLALAEHVSALPEPVPVNVNTAGPMVLRALGGDGISTAAAEGATAGDRDYDRVSAFFEQALPGMLGRERLFSVYSKFFEVEVQVTLRNRHVYLKSVLYRDPDDGSVQVISRTLSPPEQLSMVPDTRR